MENRPQRYLVAHEMVHMIEPHHTNAFWVRK
ncbi:MAG: M48 family metallopeptidase [Scytonema sp. RU_4_4]|nr:M48 family metallopeptidase [Scytonema sp. RU_4_4]